MKQKINIVIISIVALAMIIASFVFAINFKNKTTNRFNDSGYIISNSYEENEDSVNKLYFDKETNYSKTNNEKFSFVNSEGKKVSVSEESFVHYTDGSVMSLKKGVAIDLNNIDSKLISYYNVFEGSILKKIGEFYEISNLNNKINFSRLMYKISNNKYLIAAPNIIISFSDEQIVEMDKFVEIEYASENVIRIYNDKANYQTIASDLYVIVDDIKIDLEYKTISKKDVEYLTMADMIINSDDNIEILPTPDKENIVEEDDKQNDKNDNSNSGDTNNDLQEGLDNITGNLPEQNEEIDNPENYEYPIFRVDNIDITTLGFENLKLSYEDESSVLFGDRSVEILENSTGKVIEKFDDWSESAPDYIINSYFGLKPNTEYTINVVGEYKIKDVTYDRTFISKIFRTLDLGLEIKNDCITSDSLSFAVYRNSYSTVNGFTYNITDKNGNIVVKDTPIKFNDDNTDVLIFSESTNIEPNKNYILTIKNFQYGTDIFLTMSYEALKLTHEVKTLKENPFKTITEDNVQLKSTIDGGKNSVIFSIEGINDLYGGIKGYTYNIYDSSTNKLKYSLINDKDNYMTIDINKLDISNAYFNVGIDFEDNEKTIVYTSNNSTPIKLSGSIDYPKVVRYTPSLNNDDYETLKGEILLSDQSNYIEVNSRSYYKVVLKEKTDGTLGNSQQYVETDERVIEFKKTASEYALPIYFEGLKSSTQYVTYVYLIQENKEIYLGYAEAETPAALPVYLNFFDETVQGENLFDFNIKKIAEKENISNGKLRKLVLDLYRCSNLKCEKFEGFSATIPSHVDDLILNNMTMGDEIISINSNDNFNFTIDDYEKEYTYKIVATGFSYNDDIPIIINDSRTNEFDIEFNEIIPPLNINIVEVLKSDTSELTGNNSNKQVKNDTVVGFNFEISTDETPMGDVFGKMNYNIFEGNCKNIIGTQIKSGSINFDVMEKTVFIPVDTDLTTDSLKRGKNYCIKYNGEYTTSDGEKISSEEDSKDFIATKQRAEIDGYVKRYDGEKVTFQLNIVDPDSALVSSVLLIDSVEQDEVKPISSPGGGTGEYTYKINDNNPYNLEIVENIGYRGPFEEGVTNEEYLELGKQEFNIYNIDLDSVIVKEKELKVEIDSTSVGFVTIKIPLCETNCQNSILNKDNFNRISGLKIGENFIGLTLSETDKMLFTKINLSDIDKNGYGTIENGMLNFANISLIYDSGKIDDYREFNQVFVKAKTEDIYYNLSERRFISKPNSIINNANINSLGITNMRFISSDENSSIGHALKDKNDTERLIHFNRLESIDINVEKNIPVTEIMSTSEITKKYTSTGAEIYFDVTTGEKEGSNLIVNLKSDENSIDISKSIQFSNGKWNSKTFDDNDYIKSIYVDDDGIIRVVFDNLIGKTFKYSLMFGSDKFTYNDKTQSYNKELSINSLKRLNVIYKAVELQQSGWKFSEDFKDLNFDRKMKIDFNVDLNEYIPQNNEKIIYNLIAKELNGQEYKLAVGNIISDTNHVEYSLSNTALQIGEYKIILESVIKDVGTGDIELEDITIKENVKITTNDPGLIVKSSGEPTFNITINDSDGKLAACTNDIGLPTTKLIDYVDDGSKVYFETGTGDKKVVYFELYSLNGDVEIYRGYSPIPFAKTTSTLNAKQYFYDNNLLPGNYRVKMKYCTIDDTEKILEKVEDFSISNSINLNVQVLNMPDGYILMLDNPSIQEKDNIKKIEYQYILNDGTPITRTLDNTNDVFNKNDNFEFTVSEGVNGSVYFLGLSTGNFLTVNIKSLSINFYNEQGTVIAQWSK